MKYLIGVDLNTPSHLLASTLRIPHACQWPLAKGHKGQTISWAGWAYYLLQREKLYFMGSLNKKKKMIGFGLWLGDLGRDKLTIKQGFILHWVLSESRSNFMTEYLNKSYL